MTENKIAAIAGVMIGALNYVVGTCCIIRAVKMLVVKV